MIAPFKIRYINNIITGINIPIILVIAVFKYSLSCSLFSINNILYIKTIIAVVTPILCFVHIAIPANIPYYKVIFFIIF